MSSASPALASAEPIASDINSDANSERHLKVAWVEFPPYAYKGEDGSLQGDAVHDATKVFDEAGFDWEADIYPSKRLIAYLAIGKIDVWIGIKDSRLALFTITGTLAINQLYLRMYHISPTQPYTSKQDLNGKRVIVMRGYQYGDGLLEYIEDSDNDIYVIESDDHLHALLSLERGRADYLLNYKVPVEATLKKRNVANLHYTDLHSTNLYFVVSKMTDDAELVLAELERAFTQANIHFMEKYDD